MKPVARNMPPNMYFPTRFENYVVEHSCGEGSFGQVFLARHITTGARVAIKTVEQDPNYKNREREIITELQDPKPHPNIVQLHDSYIKRYRPSEGAFSTQNKILHLIMEYIPSTFAIEIQRYAQAYSPAHRRTGNFPIVTFKSYWTEVRAICFQLFRSVAYIHSRGYTHRDIKPQNVLACPATLKVKLCDFGSAKVLDPEGSNLSYICSRYYRAPELMYSSRKYSSAVDMWSVGCVIAEVSCVKESLYISTLIIKPIHFHSWSSDVYYLAVTPALSS
eukprot:GHVH01006950.1.p1 GENE.GHVH01006950.1~~GHVH01006950.1.p1  ORF type:complete len:277 (+),score=17.79 GHVH01006950.1:177-1007(+)